MDLSILQNKNDFLDLVTERLGKSPIDFCERVDAIEKTKIPRSAAGVLLPLAFGPASGAVPEFRVLLIKRSSLVPQAGDLSYPGGMLERMDVFLRPLVASRLIPVLKGRPRMYAVERGRSNFRSITLFLTNALRESWEEINLNPLQVEFLGPLPCRNLVMFTKTIFPLVGLVRRPELLRANHEVEKIVDIPLAQFFQKENYALFSIENMTENGRSAGEMNRFPCFIHREVSGEEEILWGATFSIMLNFLKIVFSFDAPAPTSNWVLKKTLRPGYMTGNGRQEGKRP
jgi:8-oxo-dGTP pyrophosphatase MutT (NUDIX family)